MFRHSCFLEQIFSKFYLSLMKRLQSWTESIRVWNVDCHWNVKLESVIKWPLFLVVFVRESSPMFHFTALLFCQCLLVKYKKSLFFFPFNQSFFFVLKFLLPTPSFSLSLYNHYTLCGFSPSHCLCLLSVCLFVCLLSFSPPFSLFLIAKLYQVRNSPSEMKLVGNFISFI